MDSRKADELVRVRMATRTALTNADVGEPNPLLEVMGFDGGGLAPLAGTTRLASGGTKSPGVTTGVEGTETGLG